MDTEYLYGEALRDDQDARARLAVINLLEWLHSEKSEEELPNHAARAHAIVDVAIGLRLNTAGVREKLVEMPF